MANLKATSGIIQDLLWTKNDSHFLFCGNDSTIYECDTQLWTKKSYLTSNGKFTSLVLTEKMIIAAGTEANKNIIVEMQQLKGEEKLEKLEK